MKTEIYVDKISNKELTKEIQYIGGKIKNETYWLDGELHREDGPANIWYNDDKISVESYYLNGEHHRDNGFARIWYNKEGTIGESEYWIKGKLITDPLQVFVIETLGIEIK